MEEKNFKLSLENLYSGEKQRQINALEHLKQIIQTNSERQGGKIHQWLFQKNFIFVMLDLLESEEEEILESFLTFLDLYVQHIKQNYKSLSEKLISINKILPVFEKLMQMDSQKIRAMAIEKFCKIYHEVDFEDKEESVISLIKKFSFSNNMFSNVSGICLSCCLFSLIEDPKNKNEIIQ